jgi:hypothetical protein
LLHMFGKFMILKSASSASFLDLYLEFDHSGQLSTKIYDKQDDFNFKIINFPNICSNIPASPAYQLWRIYQLSYPILSYLTSVWKWSILLSQFKTIITLQLSFYSTTINTFLNCLTGYKLLSIRDMTTVFPSRYMSVLLLGIKLNCSVMIVLNCERRIDYFHTLVR